MIKAWGGLLVAVVACCDETNEPAWRFLSSA
jgi:hypothetical protein